MLSDRIAIFARSFSSAPRKLPLFLADNANGQTNVFLSSQPNSLKLGSFATNRRSELEPAFTRRPDTRDEPRVLLQNPGLFKENKSFWPRAAQILKQHIHLDQTYQDLVAAETRTQFFHIYDLRLPPVSGRIPEVEDILGTVELNIAEDFSTIVPHSFEPNAMYRPVTQFGAMLLPEFSHELLAKKLVE